MRAREGEANSAPSEGCRQGFTEDGTFGLESWAEEKAFLARKIQVLVLSLIGYKSFNLSWPRHLPANNSRGGLNGLYHRFQLKKS